MDRTLELVSVNLRAIGMLPDSDRQIAIDRLAALLERQDEDLETDLAAFGGAMRKHLVESTGQGARSVEDERRLFIEDIEKGLQDVDTGRVMSTEELKDWFRRERGLRL